MTCSPKTDPVVKLVFRYIIGLRKGKTHATKAIDLPPLFVPPLKLEFVFIQIVGA